MLYDAKKHGGSHLDVNIDMDLIIGVIFWVYKQNTINIDDFYIFISKDFYKHPKNITEISQLSGTNSGFSGQ